MDYSLLRRREFAADQLDELPSWDYFLAAYNKSERVNALFSAVRAIRKEWVIHPEYDFPLGDLPNSGTLRVIGERDEAEFCLEYLTQSGL